MKLNSSYIFFVIWLLIFGYNSRAQNQIKTQVFSIRTLGMNVGEIKVFQEEKGSKLVIKAISEFEVRIVFKIKGKYIQSCVYSEGELLKSSLKTYKKDKVNSEICLTKNGNGYVMDKEGEISLINDVIRYSGSLLFFNEPHNVKDLYLEVSGEKTTVEPHGNHKYLITNPRNGKKNLYIYENKVLKKAVIKHAISTIFLERK